MSAVALQHEVRLEIADLETGEAVDVSRLSDVELGRLQIKLSAMAREYRFLEGEVWKEINRRAREQGGLCDGIRRFMVRRVSSVRVDVEPIEDEGGD